MSYRTVWLSSQDSALLGRVIACCAEQGSNDPLSAMQAVLWPLVSASDVAAAYAQAVADGSEEPGADESVITDAMILANVQHHLPLPQPAPPPPPEEAPPNV